MKRPRRHSGSAAGFTLVELVMVMVLVSILAVYAAVSTPTNAEATLSEQAHLLARNLRHAQTLAMTWGRPLRFSVPSTSVYEVRCVTGGTPPCDLIPVTDPARNQEFRVTLDYTVTIAGPTIDFDSKGQPSAAGVFTLSTGAASRTVTVSALTGFVTVSP